MQLQQQIPSFLIEYVESTILPQYQYFDKAHQQDHVLKVIHESLRLTAFYPVSVSQVYVIAAYHDLGLSKGRERHHIVSGEILLADSHLRKWFTQAQLMQMREAIEDHRASNSHVPRSIYGKIVAEADRSIQPEVTMRRTVQYGLCHYPALDKEQQWMRFGHHLEEKYGTGGYLKLWLPESANASQLQKLQQIIADKSALRDAFEAIYESEMSKD